jgi:type IV secretion system protein VirB9
MKELFLSYGVFICAVTLCATPQEAISKANKTATTEPTSSHFFNAGLIFEWEQGRLYQIYTKPERITDIAFEVGEQIVSIGGGESQRWTISDTQSGKEPYMRKHIFVKPHQIDISTNLVITTDRRTYHIELHSLDNVPYQASVSWKYPGSALIIANDTGKSTNEVVPETPLSGLGKRQLNFNYHFVATERPAWMPRRVFDDGHKTYIEFPEGMQDTEAPILYGLSNAKQQEVINYRRHKNFYIIDHMTDVAELTIGGKSAITVGFERERI